MKREFIKVMRKEEYKGFNIIGTLNVLGIRCGYIQIPEDNYYYNKDYLNYDNIDDIQCHGGITFSGTIDIFSNSDNEFNGKFYIGFDCGHFSDKIDYYGAKNIFGPKSECRIDIYNA